MGFELRRQWDPGRRCIHIVVGVGVGGGEFHQGILFTAGGGITAGSFMEVFLRGFGSGVIVYIVPLFIQRFERFTLGYVLGLCTELVGVCLAGAASWLSSTLHAGWVSAADPIMVFALVFICFPGEGLVWRQGVRG